MYCPRCGQEQPNQDVQFCSRCGLRVALVKDLLTTINTEGGEGVYHLEKISPLKQKKVRFFRKPKYRRSAHILFASFALFPITLFISLVFNNPVFLVFSLLPFFIGSTSLIYKRFFTGDEPESTHKPVELNTNPVQAYLNPPNLFANPLADSRIKTAEMVPPPSVTENTTRRLEK